MIISLYFVTAQTKITHYQGAVLHLGSEKKRADLKLRSKRESKGKTKENPEKTYYTAFK